MWFYQKHTRNLFWRHWFIKLWDDSHPSNFRGLVMANTHPVQWYNGWLSQHWNKNISVTSRPFFKEMWFIDQSCLKIKTYPPPPHTHTHTLSLHMCLHFLVSLLTGDDGCTPRVLQVSLTMPAATVWMEGWGTGQMDTVLPWSMWSSLVSQSSRLIN